MKRILVLFLLLTCLSACSTSTNATNSITDYEQLFAQEVLEIYVTIAEEDWQSILENPLAKEYKSVTVKINDIELDNVGFSTKGNSTLTSVANSDSDRYSFRLNFDKFVDGQTLLGLNKLSLNNNMSDASYMREYIHYMALREAGAAASLVTYANVYINGELFGFYTVVENVEESFLERNYGNAYEAGVIYDAEERSTLVYNENENYTSYTIDYGVDENNAQLKNFIKVLNEMTDGKKGDIESVLDVDSALIYIAANTVFGSYDSYNGAMAHNYKLYADGNGYFTIIPWDYNMSFNGFSQGGDAITVALENPILNTTEANTPLIQNLLAVEEYYERYLEYVEYFMSYLENIEEITSELSERIRTYVEADPSKFYTIEEFDLQLVYNENEETNGSFMQGDFELPEGMDNIENVPNREDWNMDELPEGMEDFITDGMMPGGEIPEGMEGFINEGERPSGMAGGDRGNGDWVNRGGGMMSSTAGSLVTFALNRLENLRQQLAD